MKIKSLNIFTFCQVIFILALLKIFSPAILLSQNVKENQLRTLNSQLQENDNRLLQLTGELESKVEFINLRKAEPGFDEDEIKNLMSNTANLTNQIERLQVERDSLTKKYNQIKNDLYLKYTGKIDSLNKSGLPEQEKNSLITKLIEKRLYVSPKIEILSFEPSKILSIDTKKDSQDIKIQREFLTSAKDEIESKLNELSELKNEIATVIDLNRETKDFLEEAEFDNDISYFRSTVQSNETSRNASLGGGNEYNNSLKTQADTFTEILTQLDYNDVPDERTYSLNNILINNDIEEFNRLILSVEQQLNDYKTVINNKLKN